MDRKTGRMILILAIFLIVFEAVPEGLKTAGKYLASECLEFIYLTGITLMTFAWVTGILFPFGNDYSSLLKVIIAYILLRFSSFDVIWNLSCGQNIAYIGSTKMADRLLLKIKRLWGMSPIWFARAIALFWGLAWLLNIGQ